MIKRSFPLLLAATVWLSAAHAQGPTVQYKRKIGPNEMTEVQKTQATHAYLAALHTFCPKQRLQLQTPDQLNLQVQDFEHFISPPQTARYRMLVDDSCVLHEAAQACADTAMIVAAQEGKFLDRFAVFQCEKGIQCRAAGKCTPPTR